MGMIIAFLVSPLGRIAAAIGIGLSMWAFVKFHYEAAGAAKATEKFQQAGERNARKAEAARRSVDAVPDDRLRDRYFRD
jgi:hypothetical protein